ncbi:SDR family oxidoreductase [Mesorhizobium sp. B2-5-13]|uniref:D-erythronate dehydrogenase n=1 Tax=unclassified Mesorhizobium TaxID=325217 RepID=UPI00112B9C12|nr:MULTISPECIES: D-erythronate dehydrogenase [unclassified Mesorhizobium]TPJ88169.1 SDR family oxidoreductase [Mesorhizobium sp. B2-5-13]TPK52364.1 SDR family oxidoreductase [Mesorhizobium sp. B2-5-5]
MHAMIIGAAGMIGRKLSDRLVQEGAVGGAAITQLSLVDVVPPVSVELTGAAVDCITSDLSQAGAAASLAASRPDVIFHLAAIVSSDAEANFEKGYRINLDGTRLLFEAIRLEGEKRAYRPRVVFTSSLAVFGQPLPDEIPDDFVLAPLSSYGTQKAICELLLADYSRRGFFDGIALRLPTICVRPGKPNKAASGFYSGIIREPLAGQPSVLPVPRTLRHWFASPRSAITALVHAAAIDLKTLGARRSINLPGVSATVGDQIDALRRVAGDGAVDLIREEPDPAVFEIVSSWPRGFTATRAKDLGFAAETSMDEIIHVHIEDELGGTLN